MKKLPLLSIFLVISIISNAQVVTPFTVRKTITQKGNILFLSNTSSMAVPANVVQNEMPSSGTGVDNNYVNGFVDVDNDPTTWMSSSDSLHLPTCSSVTWAGLYWGGSKVSSDPHFATRNQVKIKANNGVYLSLTADYLFDNTTGFNTYNCFKDITTLLQQNGLNVRYSVANMEMTTGGKNLFGGWTIVVIYKDNTTTTRNLTVFDGLANVESGTNSTVNIPISGFQTPLSGPVTFELGLVAYDGDRSYTGDQLLFNGAGSYVNISDVLHPVSDIFNSTLARDGVLTPFRVPAYNNTLGYDANIFAPVNTTKNYIGNNAISAIIKQTTGGETYLTQVVTSAIDVYEPDLRSAVRVKNLSNPGSLTAQPGDTLQYTVNGLNIGSDPSVNTYINDTIEGNAHYVPGSLKIIFGPNTGALTDAAGDDQGEYIASSKVIRVRIGTGANSFSGGLVNNSPAGTDSTQFVYKVTATNDCVYLACDSIINNSAFIIGTGNISGNTFSNASNPGIFDPFGCPIPGSTQTLIHTAGCSPPSASANSPICQGGTINFTASSSPSATYAWTGPNGFTSTLGNPTITNVTGANSGTYTANIYITGTTCHFTYPFTTNINIANAGPDQTGNTTCGLSTVTLAGNYPTGSTGGAWSVISGSGGSFANTFIPTTTFTGTPGASYTLQWQLNSSSCPSTTDQMNVKFNQSPTSAVLSGTTAICYNGYASLKVIMTGGVSPYTVTLNNGGGTFTSYISGNDLIVGPLTATTTFGLVSVTDANGCSSSGLSGNATVTVSGAITGSGTITQNTPPSSGTAGPSTFSTTTTTGTNYAWVNPNNMKVSDNVWATQTITGSSTAQALLLKGFGFSIPANATINGIAVQVERHYTTTATRTIRDRTIQLLKAGAVTGSNLGLTSTTWPLTTDATVTYGGPTNLWGTTWAASDINNANFGLELQVKRYTPTGGSGNPEAFVDLVTIEVYYSTSYCDDASGQIFTVSSFTNATNYAWTSPSGGNVTSGQGTVSATMNFNGAGQSGNYNICVTPSNNCQTLTASCISIPINDCVNSSLYIMGNIYWDKNAMTDNLVNGTGVGIANATQLYVTLEAGAGTTALQNSVAVGSDGTYQFAVSASTAYKIVLSTTSYTTGQTPIASLPSGCSNTGEILNNLTNTLTGNDGTTNGILSVTSLPTNNVVNANFGIKISTPPVAVNDITTTNENTSVTYNVTSNDYDVDGNVVVNTVDLDPGTGGIQNTFINTYGTWSVSALGVVTFTPTQYFYGNASVNYTVKDNDGNTSNIGTLLVSVKFVNQAPFAVNDAVITLENTTATINVTSNDYDVDGTIDVTSVDLDPATAGIQTTFSVSGQGTYTVDNTGLITFTPILNYYGIGTPVNYTMKDNLGATSNSDTLTVTVTQVLVPPIAVADTATTQQNIPVKTDITSNDIGPDSPIDPATVDLDPLTSGIQNSFMAYGEGSYAVNNSGIVTFTPIAGFYGTTTPISYTVNDNLGYTSNSATITITVIPNGAPKAVADTASTNEGSSVSFNVTTNDTAFYGNTINVSRVDLDPLTSGIQQFYEIPGQGTFMVDMTGLVTFQPDWEFYGTVVGYYTVKDNAGLISNVAKIAVTVKHVNQPPVAVNDTFSTLENIPVTYNVITNDYDSDGSVAPNSVDLDPSTPGNQTTFTVTGEGTYTTDNLGNVTFTPVLYFNGVSTPIYYTINDNEGLSSDINNPGMITVTVIHVNQSPNAVNDSIFAPSDVNVVFNVTSNDSDVDGTVDATTVDLDPSFPGTQNTFTVANEGTYTVDNTGTVTFTPLPAFIGPVTATPISYTVNDNSGATSNSATITIILADPNAPQAVNDNASMNENGTPVTIDVTANDVAGSGNIVVSTIDLDPNTAGQQTSLVTTQGTWSVNTSTGIVTFTPVANFFGTAIINYTVSDDNLPALASNAASVTVTVNFVNQAPSFVKGSDLGSCENSDVQIVNNWATALSAGPADESSQTLTFVVTNNNNSLFSLQPTIDATGNLYYTPATNQSGSATVSVNIKDNGGTANGGVNASAIQTFTISINSQNVPVIGTITQPSCSTVTGSVAFSGLPASGTWTVTETVGSTTITGTGTTATFSGLTAGTYTFTVTNASGCTSLASASAIINVQPATPVAPIVGIITQTTCSTATGSVDLSGLPASGTWTVTESVGSTTITGSGTTATFSGLTAGTYSFTVTNASGCTSVASASAIINVQPATPVAPIVGVITQTTCSTAAGSVDLSGLPASGTWTVTESVGSTTITGSGTTATFSGLTAGTYSFTVTNTSGCTSLASAGAIINVQPATPVAPIVGVITQTTCSTATGSVDLSGLPASGTWTVTENVGSTTITGTSTTATFSGLTAGTYTFTVTNASGCTSVASESAIINVQPATPVAPSASSPQIFCSGNSPTVSSIEATGSNLIWYDAATAGSVIDGTTALINGFTYYASQTVGGCESSSRTDVTVSILACTGPSIIDNSVSINEYSSNGTVVYDVNDNNTGEDKDIDGNSLTYSILSGNSSGGFVIDPSTGIITVIESTKLSYKTTPTFVLIVQASNGTVADNASITINLKNNHPVSVADSYNVNAGDTLSVPAPGILTNDYDTNGNDLTAIKITDPVNGTLTFNADGSFIYINSGSAAASDSFSYTANNGIFNGDTVMETITIHPVNHPPILSNISKSVNEGDTLTFAVTDFSSAFSDVDGNTMAKIKITGLPANGTLQLSGIAVSINQEISASSLGNLTFVPNAGWNGSSGFTWNGFDGTVYSTSDAQVNLTVNAVSHAPVINTSPLSVSINENGGADTIDIAANVTNIDGGVLTTSVSGNPKHGSVTIDGSGNIIYTPNANFSGIDSITYQVCNSTLPPKCTTGITIVTVNPVHHPPSLVSSVITDSIPANGGTTTIDLSNNIINVDGDTLSTSISIQSKHGTAIINSSGQLVYTPDAGYIGNDTMSYQVCNNVAPPQCVTGEVVITATGNVITNHAPVISDISKTSVENTTLQFLLTDFTSNFTDADHDTLVKIQIISLPANGTLSFNGIDITAGEEITSAELKGITFIPSKDFSGETSFEWEASDGKDYSLQASVTITVTPQTIFIPEGFSPNGDGINDNFVIKGADQYVITLQVFNRWGDMVYQSKHYQNDWDGVANSGLLINTKLPDGTYFYLINFNNGEKEKIGYITINR